jgi:hypothetical protein
MYNRKRFSCEKDLEKEHSAGITAGLGKTVVGIQSDLSVW